MDMTNKEYGEYVNGKSKPSPILKNLIWAFVIGGLICTVGQGLLNLYKKAGLTAEDAGSAVSMTLIFAAALLTGLVPITGFANAMVSPALEFKSEGFITGTGAKLFTVAGPVLVFGISASILYGILLVLFFRG